MTVTKEDFDDYEDVRKSGATNMFDVRTVEMLSGLDRATQREIRENYDALRKQYAQEEEETQ